MRSLKGRVEMSCPSGVITGDRSAYVDFTSTFGGTNAGFDGVVAGVAFALAISS